MSALPSYASEAVDPARNFIQRLPLELLLEILEPCTLPRDYDVTDQLYEKQANRCRLGRVTKEWRSLTNVRPNAYIARSSPQILSLLAFFILNNDRALVAESLTIGCAAGTYAAAPLAKLLQSTRNLNFIGFLPEMFALSRQNGGQGSDSPFTRFVGEAVLDGLCSLKYVKHFRLGTFLSLCDIDVSENEVDCLLEAWPQLEHLELSGVRSAIEPRPTFPRPSLTSLSVCLDDGGSKVMECLLRASPHLLHLSVMWDALYGEWSPPNYLINFLPTSLVTLYMYSDVQGDAPPLDIILPPLVNLKRLSLQCGYTSLKTLVTLPQLSHLMLYIDGYSDPSRRVKNTAMIDDLASSLEQLHLSHLELRVPQGDFYVSLASASMSALKLACKRCAVRFSIS